MDRFSISYDYDKINLGFQDYVRIDLSKPTIPQLRRRYIPVGLGVDVDTIKTTIQLNSSLKVSFGWSFESDYQLLSIMKECEEYIFSQYNEAAGSMITDMSCDWVGFVPHNAFDREIYNGMSMYSMILYNNEMISFQENVISYLTSHPMYKDHAILRDEWYRFNYFKKIRKDSVALSIAYQYYMDAVKNTCGLESISKDILETQLGCHYLYHPDLFFELLEFSILKGEIYV